MSVIDGLALLTEQVAIPSAPMTRRPLAPVTPVVGPVTRAGRAGRVVGPVTRAGRAGRSGGSGRRAGDGGRSGGSAI